MTNLRVQIQIMLMIMNVSSSHSLKLKSYTWGKSTSWLDPYIPDFQYPKLGPCLWLTFKFKYSHEGIHLKIGDSVSKLLYLIYFRHMKELHLKNGDFHWPTYCNTLKLSIWRKSTWKLDPHFMCPTVKTYLNH